MRKRDVTTHTSVYSHLCVGHVGYQIRDLKGKQENIIKLDTAVV